MISIVRFLLLVVSIGLAKACTPSGLINGGFETGKIAPWTVSNENVDGLPALTITETAYGNSKYAANLSLIYQPSDKHNSQHEQMAPLIDIYQYIQACGVPQTLSLWYNIQPNPKYESRFNPFIYDIMTHDVFVNAFVYYNSSSDVDSLGNKYGTWNRLGPYQFTPKNNTMILSVVTGGAYGKTHGTATILVDNVRLVNAKA